MALVLFNTASQKKETFEALEKGAVKMYHCGPTVYDYAHIGNLRTYIFGDTLRRVMEYEGFKIKQVINITDVGHLSSDADEGDDKMMKGLKREGLPATLDGLKTLADKYEAKFKEDLASLNIETEGTEFPRATSFVAQDITLIQKLEEKDFAYKTPDGVYFDTEKFKDYGKLGGLTPLGEEKDRVTSLNKKNPRDFALWKLSQDTHLGFESPWGVGFPGWHIECSVMSERLLGQPFDIHTGGVDHIPVHHNNEIAQSEAAYDKPLANYWLHGAFVTLKDAKMAKSSGGFITLPSLVEKGFSPLSYRYFVLGAHYRSPLNFTEEGLEGSATAYKKLLNHFLSLGDASGEISPAYKNKFKEAIEDDLNTPKVLALIWDLLKDDSVTPPDKRTTLIAFDQVLGLNLESESRKIEKNLEDIPTFIKNLVSERESARKNGDFKKADKLRDQISKLGYKVEDSEKGVKVTSV